MQWSWSCCSSIFSSSSRELQISKIAVKLGKWGLVAENSQAHAEVIFDIKQKITALKSLPISEINDALIKFNEQFFNVSFNVSSMVDVVIEGQDAAVLQQIRDILVEPHSPVGRFAALNHNILAAFLDVGMKMHKNQSDLSLIYHQLRHAVEMFFDAHQLLNVRKVSALNVLHVYLLMPLCTLYHDVIFTNHRIDDEIKSAEALKIFLNSMLRRLTIDERNIIEQLIDVFIIGGTLPLFLNHLPPNRKPMQNTVFEIAALLMSEIVPQKIHTILPLDYSSDSVRIHCALSDITQTMSRLDIQRTTIPMLHANNEFYDSTFYQSEDWNIIGNNALSLISLSNCDKKRIAQSFRIMSEMILLESKKEKHADYYWARYLRKIQANQVHEPPVLPDSIITVICGKLDGEIKFSERMRNTYVISLLKEDRQHTILDPSDSPWMKHVNILGQLQHFFEKHADTEKQKEVIHALSRVAVTQDGQNLSLKNIYLACNQLEQAACQFEVSSPGKICVHVVEKTEMSSGVRSAFGT